MAVGVAVDSNHAPLLGAKPGGGSTRKRWKRVQKSRTVDRSDVAVYLENRSLVLRILLAASSFMVFMAIYCLMKPCRIRPDQDGGEIDKQFIRQTILINLFVYVILGMLWRSDNSDQSKDNLQLKGLEDFASQANQFAWYGSCLSHLMPLNNLLALTLYPHVGMDPRAAFAALPLWFNALFMIGSVTYMLSILWLIISSMSRQVRATWQFRQQVIEQIKEIEKPGPCSDSGDVAQPSAMASAPAPADEEEGPKSAGEKWGDLCLLWLDLDDKLDATWDLTNAGLIWCPVTLASMTLALVGMYNIISNPILSSRSGVWAYLEVVMADPMSAVYFVVGTIFALLLGLVLSSTAFVAPFRFPGFCAKRLPEEYRKNLHRSDANTEKDDETLKYAGQCVQKLALFVQHNKNDPFDSSEQNRFIHCAQYMPLGAKLGGMPITKALVVRLFVQMAGGLPILLSILHATANGADTRSATSTLTVAVNDSLTI